MPNNSVSRVDHDHHYHDHAHIACATSTCHSVTKHAMLYHGMLSSAALQCAMPFIFCPHDIFHYLAACKASSCSECALRPLVA